MTAAEIRQQFLDFFASKGHTIVASSSLVPGNDPTLLFTNSGMVQFKDVFLGTDKRNYVRAASVQRCLRAGGKHNDLENVGYTARHHTFFEMLGNWSFGDYFKHDALVWAWELLTKQYGLPADKLWATVYQTDDEAFDIWTKVIGLPPERVVRIGDNKGAPYASDNFWQMADTGPCGPCSEIFYDHGPDVWGGPPGSAEQDGDRYIEIWNNVFMQFDRQIDPATGEATLTPLPAPCVDTGMGLERLAAVLQHVHSNYEIDLFQRLLAAAARETKTSDLKAPSLNVIADHIRACSFLIVDGVIPGNEGRGYVLRRIIRRAIRHGYKLGTRIPFFYKLVDALTIEMGDAYPELQAQQTRVTEVLRLEEERFFQTIANGMELLDASLAFERVYAVLPRYQDKNAQKGTSLRTAKGTPFKACAHMTDRGRCVVIPATNQDGLTSASYIYESDWGTNVTSQGTWSHQWIEALNEFAISVSSPFVVLSGDIAFKLHDTFGFPLDLTADVCRERGVTVDEDAFNVAMSRQRDQARAAGKFKTGTTALDYSGEATQFFGYESLAVESAKVVALYREGAAVNSIASGEDAIVVLDRTPFYAESGGQVGDTGEIVCGDVCTTLFKVADTQRIQANVFGHHGSLIAGELKVGDKVIASVDTAHRAATVRNHSATHLMHKALREVLGGHVQQKGSLVDADKTRFDFVHNAPMTDEELRRVEVIVTREILSNEPTSAREMAIEDAQKSGAMMLFGEKYGDSVRVLDIGSSRELCGGTHVTRTGDIGAFKIVAESGVAAGVRRVEAVTGENALAYVQQQESLLHEVASALKAPVAEAAQRIAQLLEHARAAEKELAQLKAKLASGQGDQIVSQAIDVKGIKVLAAVLDGADVAALRDAVDKLKDKLGSAAILLAAVADGKVSLIAGVTSDLTAKVKAGELVNMVALQVGGKGGGRPDMAQAGGTDASKLPAALASVKEWVADRL